jgi:hypothetical protein
VHLGTQQTANPSEEDKKYQSFHEIGFTEKTFGSYPNLIVPNSVNQHQNDSGNGNKRGH